MSAFRDTFGDVIAAVPDEFYDDDRFVPAVGSLDAAVMLIGEAPGANEVAEGEPFVGRAGKRLDDILDEIGVNRDALYITNLVKIRPPNNRDPHRDEIDAWKPVLEAEIERVDPETILTLGNFATKELTGTSDGITQTRGRTFRLNDHKIVPTYHPAATLYDNSKRPALKKDLLDAFGKKESGQKGLEDF
jgi:DNA polymerase